MSKYNKTITLVLCVFFGWLGVHRFYVGKVKTGILYLLTFGIGGLGWLIDILLIIFDKFKDSTGNYIKSPNDNHTDNNKTEIETGKMTSLGAYISDNDVKGGETKATSIYKTDTSKPSDYQQKRKERIRFLENQFSDELNEIPKVNIVLNTEPIKRVPVSSMPYVEFYSIRKNTNIKKIGNFIVIDVETTGLKASCEIIELAAIKFIDFKPVEKFESLVKPKKSIPEEITKINGISNEMVENAPMIYEIIPAFREFCQGFDIVGHNLSFDLKFIYCAGYDIFSEDHRFIDTLSSCKNCLIRYEENKAEHSDFTYDVINYKLETVCNYYNIFLPNAHRAAADCYATGLLFKNLVSDITETYIK